jgi:hypothetical protein
MSLASAIINAAKSRNQLAPLQFPSDLGDYQMILNFHKYDYRLATGRTNSQGVVADSIALPLPANITDTSRIEVGGKQIGGFGALASDIASGVQNLRQSYNSLSTAAAQATQQSKNIVGSMASGIQSGNFLDALSAGFSDSTTAAAYVLRGLAGKVSPQVEQGVGSVLGNAMNPHATLVFDGVDLKIHNFEWVCAPRNEREAETLKKIISKVQYHIHPDYKTALSDGTGEGTTGILSLDRGLLTYPSLMSVNLVGNVGNWVIKFDKMMMVNQFNVDYTPNGVALNRGGSPAVVRLSMNVTEAQIRTKADYNDGAATSTGATNSAIVNTEDSANEQAGLAAAVTATGTPANGSALPPLP